MPKSQMVQITNWLTSGKKLTALQALQRFGCMRLAARISELKGFGWDVQRVMIKKDGKKYAQYFIPKESR